MKQVFGAVFICLMSFCSLAQTNDILPSDFSKLVQNVKLGKSFSTEVVKKYSGFESEFNDDPNFYLEVKISEVVYINDSILGIVIETATGVGGTEDIETFSYRNKEIGSIELSNNFDHDQASPDYFYQDYRFIARNLIETEKVSFSVLDSGCIDKQGYFKEGYIFDNCTKSDTLYSYFSILDDGKIKEVELDVRNKKERDYSFASLKLLTENDLKSYSKKELRLIRNEIFANKGYSFRSQDLKSHFGQFDWYDPKFKDVNERITLIEAKNIELIKRLERK